MITVDELLNQRAEVGARYKALVRELLDARIELAALDHVLASPIAGHRNGDVGFVGDVNELPRSLAHGRFCPFSSYALPSVKINARITQLAESLSIQSNIELSRERAHGTDRLHRDGRQGEPPTGLRLQQSGGGGGLRSPSKQSRKAASPAVRGGLASLSARS